jgi:hypothetical protein
MGRYQQNTLWGSAFEWGSRLKLLEKADEVTRFVAEEEDLELPKKIKDLKEWEAKEARHFRKEVKHKHKWTMFEEFESLYESWPDLACRDPLQIWYDNPERAANKWLGPIDDEDEDEDEDD